MSSVLNVKWRKKEFGRKPFGSVKGRKQVVKGWRSTALFCVLKAKV